MSPKTDISTAHVGAAKVALSSLGVGTAGLNQQRDQAEATRVIAAALDLGINYFDTAPYYDLGQAELALGAALQEIGGAPDITISTKVGRIVNPETREWHYDYSREGVLRSLESSLQRLQRDHVDIVYVHDPDNHAAEATATAFPELVKLREEGVIGAIGTGMNQWQLPLTFIQEFDLDVLLIAGRYSLLDTSAATELFPECLKRGVGIVAGGVFNSGILADPTDQATFAYRPAAPELLARARAMQAIALRHGFELADVAQAFSAGHPATTCVLVGVREEAQLRRNVAGWHRTVPAEVWAELQEAGLLAGGAHLSRLLEVGSK